MTDKPEREEELVLLVHGTFANDDADAGMAWWQRGSSTWNELKRRLPPCAELPEEGPLFHWSGENTEWARSKAANSLLRDWLIPLEEVGQPYHLIGHSHGGSVVWGALREAVRLEIPLDSLRSWASVGTPFLQYRSTAMGGVLGTVIRLLLIAIVALLALWALAFAVTPLALYFEDYYGEGSAMAVISFLALDVLLLVAVSPFIYGLFLFSRVNNEARRARRDGRLGKEAMALYGPCWLGLRATQDEAINGLRSTLGMNLSVVPRFSFSPESAFTADANLEEIHSIFGRLLDASLYPLLNIVLQGWGNSFLNSMLSKSLQGNNRPGTIVEDVTVAPLASQSDCCLPIPPEIDAEITDSANSAAKAMAPNIREILGPASVGNDAVAQLRECLQMCFLRSKAF